MQFDCYSRVQIKEEKRLEHVNRILQNATDERQRNDGAKVVEQLVEISTKKKKMLGPISDEIK